MNKVAIYLNDKFNTATSAVIYESVESLINKSDPIGIYGKSSIDVKKQAKLPKTNTDDEILEEWTLQTVNHSKNSLTLKFKLHYRKSAQKQKEEKK